MHDWTTIPTWVEWVGSARRDLRISLCSVVLTSESRYIPAYPTTGGWHRKSSGAPEPSQVLGCGCERRA
ncbi:hypothetical protein PISMIDRAFT_536176 [Pisolithus microcarpus 441]|uniref:Unplaced genomic scaffold scaffold_63, whole genome shotgun sequence n=1 Tax=Pisolithus microcarpus 441 TaxID=765257 RepID=A0A0C9YAK0_9AGAM|nr:hypothetical protein PISMIDRAFT_536176 [Pisolithus microcarpus 441]